MKDANAQTASDAGNIVKFAPLSDEKAVLSPNEFGIDYGAIKNQSLAGVLAQWEQEFREAMSYELATKDQKRRQARLKKQWLGIVKDAQKGKFRDFSWLSPYIPNMIEGFSRIQETSGKYDALIEIGNTAKEQGLVAWVVRRHQEWQEKWKRRDDRIHQANFGERTTDYPKAPKTWPFKWPYGINYKNIAPWVLSGILFNGEREWVANVEKEAEIMETSMRKEVLEEAQRDWKKYLKSFKTGKLPDDLSDLRGFAPQMLFNFCEIWEKERKKYNELYQHGHKKLEAWRASQEKEVA